MAIAIHVVSKPKKQQQLRTSYFIQQFTISTCEMLQIMKTSTQMHSTAGVGSKRFLINIITLMSNCKFHLKVYLVSPHTEYHQFIVGAIFKKKTLCSWPIGISEKTWGRNSLSLQKSWLNYLSQMQWRNYLVR